MAIVGVKSPPKIVSVGPRGARKKLPTVFTCCNPMAYIDLALWIAERIFLSTDQITSHIIHFDKPQKRNRCTMKALLVQPLLALLVLATVCHGHPRHTSNELEMQRKRASGRMMMNRQRRRFQMKKNKKLKAKKEKKSKKGSKSASPSSMPSISSMPSDSSAPSSAPSTAPSTMPSATPSAEPSSTPSVTPSAEPSSAPSPMPSTSPSASTAPSQVPSSDPSANPSANPSASPAPSRRRPA